MENIGIAMLVINSILALMAVLTFVAVMIKLRGKGNGNMSLSAYSAFLSSMGATLTKVFDPITKSLEAVQQDIRGVRKEICDVHKKINKEVMTTDKCNLAHKAHDEKHASIDKEFSGYGTRLSKTEDNVNELKRR